MILTLRKCYRGLTIRSVALTLPDGCFNTLVSVTLTLPEGRCDTLVTPSRVELTLTRFAFTHFMGSFKTGGAEKAKHYRVL